MTKRTNRGTWGLAVILAGLVSGVHAGEINAQNLPRTVPSATSKDPLRVMSRGNSVALAPALQQAVHRYFPGYRVATRRDFSPAFWRDLQKAAAGNPEVRKPFVPFAVSGDFDGDGRPDAALVLTHQRTQWRIIAFHQTPKGTFRPYVLEHRDGARPSKIDDYFIQPEPRANLPDLGIPRTGRGRQVWAQWRHDAICLTYPELERSLVYYFSGGRYHTLKVGDGDWALDE
jgi:hypothetical protein